MPNADEFTCSECGGTDFKGYVTETIEVYCDSEGNIDEYGDVTYSKEAWNQTWNCLECGKAYSALPPKDHEGEWVEAKKRHYLRTHGTQCPICGSTAIEGGSMNADGGSAWGSCSCGECGAEWRDVYHLKEVEMISYPKDMVPTETPAPAPGIPNPNEAFKNNEDN